MVQTAHSPSARWAPHLLGHWLLRRILCGKCGCSHEGAISVFVGFDCVVAVPMLEHVAMGAGLLTMSAPMSPLKRPQVLVGTHLPLQLLLLHLLLHQWPHALMASPTASFPADFCQLCCFTACKIWATVLDLSTSEDFNWKLDLPADAAWFAPLSNPVVPVTQPL